VSHSLGVSVVVVVVVVVVVMVVARERESGWEGGWVGGRSVVRASLFPFLASSHGMGMLWTLNPCPLTNVQNNHASFESDDSKKRKDAKLIMYS
jgi:hypothetical protein